MKKTLFILALGFAGFASAATMEYQNTNINEFNACANGSVNSEIQVERIYEKQEKYFLGWCEVKIFRRNADGSSTLVAYSLTIVDSEAACDAKFAVMMFEQQVKELSAE